MYSLFLTFFRTIFFSSSPSLDSVSEGHFYQCLTVFYMDWTGQSDRLNSSLV